MRMGLTQIQTEPQTIEMALRGIHDRSDRLRRLHGRPRPAPAQTQQPEPVPVPPPRRLSVVERMQAEIDRLTLALNEQFEMAKTIRNDLRVTNHSELEPAETPYPSMARIKGIVAEFYQVKVSDIISARRTMGIVRPRQVAMYLCRDMTPRSFPDIARNFGGRDHTTALSAIRKTANRMTQDWELVDEIRELKRRIYGLMNLEKHELVGSVQ